MGFFIEIFMNNDEIRWIKEYINLNIPDFQDAEEVLADIQVRAWRGTWDPGKGEYRGWLFTIARNQIRSYWSKRNSQTKLRERALRRLSRQDTTTQLEELIEAQERDEAVRMILKALKSVRPKHYQKVFELYYFKGLTHREISEKLNCKVNTSRTWCRRCRLQIKERLRKKMKRFPELIGLFNNERQS